MDYEGRISRLQEKLDGAEIDALLVTNLTNVRYLTGFTGSNAQLLVASDGARFFTDGRYEARAAQLLGGLDFDIYYTRLTDVLAPRLDAASVKRVGIEATTMTIASRDDLAERLPAVELVPTRKLVEDLRRTKEPAEVETIRAAVALGDQAFSWTLQMLQPGRTERELALDLEFHLRSSGAEDVAFPPIVGSGPLSAHIHHTPSDRPFQLGDIVLMDFGCKLDGYCSDLTRTVVLGRATDEMRSMYELVLRAHYAALDAIQDGSAGKDVDAAARQVIEDAGMGENFGHGLGHGVGLEVHEAPSAGRISEDTLRAGDVVTDEPGVYVVGTGGVRIEDCVLVTEDGGQVLGSAPKDELIEVKG